MGLTVYLRIKELEEYGEYQNIEKMAGYTVLSCKINSMSVRDACVKRMIDVVGGIIGMRYYIASDSHTWPLDQNKVTWSSYILPDKSRKKREEI